MAHPPKPLIAFIVLTVLGTSYYAYHEWKKPKVTGLVASGTIEATETPLASALGGRIEAVLVKEGQLVKKNQPLIRFDVEELTYQLKQTEAQIRAAEARIRLLRAGSRSEDIQGAEVAVKMAHTRLQQLRNGSRPAEIERAQADVEAQQSRVELAQKEAKRLEQLVHSEVATQQALDQARNNARTTQAALKLSQKNLQLVREGARQEELQLARQNIQQSQTQLRKLQNGPRSQEIEEALAVLDQQQATHDILKTRLKEQSLKASCLCTVSIVDGEPGEIISRGTPVVTLIDTHSLWVKVYVSPLELKYVRLNQPIHLRVDAYPDKTFPGKVVYLSPKAEFTPRNIQTREERIHQVFAVKVAIDNVSGQLFAGMPVDAEFQQGSL